MFSRAVIRRHSSFLGNMYNITNNLTIFTESPNNQLAGNPVTEFYQDIYKPKLSTLRNIHSIKLLEIISKRKAVSLLCVYAVSHHFPSY